MSSPVPEMCLPVEGTRTQCRNSFLNKFTIIPPPNQWIATRTGRRKVMLLPKGWKLTEVSLLVSFTTKLNEGTVFEQNSFSNICLINMYHKTAWHFWKFQKMFFMNWSDDPEDTNCIFPCLPFHGSGFFISWRFDIFL